MSVIRIYIIFMLGATSKMKPEIEECLVLWYEIKKLRII